MSHGVCACVRACARVCTHVHAARRCSARRCSARLGSARLGSARLGSRVDTLPYVTVVQLDDEHKSPMQCATCGVQRTTVALAAVQLDNEHKARLLAKMRWMQEKGIIVGAAVKKCVPPAPSPPWPDVRLLTTPPHHVHGWSSSTAHRPGRDLAGHIGPGPPPVPPHARRWAPLHVTFQSWPCALVRAEACAACASTRMCAQTYAGSSARLGCAPPPPQAAANAGSPQLALAQVDRSEQCREEAHASRQA